MMHNYARIERERRFLICSLPVRIAASDSIHIQDLYFEGNRLRLRRWQDSQGRVSFKLGHKFMPDSTRPQETQMTNFYLNDTEFQLLSRLDGRRISKRRLNYLYENVHWSIDVFEGELEKLILGEIEVKEESKETIKFPPFVTTEVTGDPFFTGGSLAFTNSDVLHRKLQEHCGGKPE